MRNLRLHTVSLLTGLGLATLLGITTAQQIVNSPLVDVRVVEPATVYTPAHPRDYVTVPDTSPYTVPVGKVFVMTAVGRGGYSDTAIRVRVNGVVVLEASFQTPALPGASIFPIPPGMTVQAGSVVFADGQGLPNFNAYVLGYLADV